MLMNDYGMYIKYDNDGYRNTYRLIKKKNKKKTHQMGIVGCVCVSPFYKWYMNVSRSDVNLKYARIML